MEKRLGNIFGFTGGNYAGNVYDQNYIAPTLNTMQGGCKQPMIIEAQAIRMVRTEEGKRLRKQYEAHEIEHGFNEHREMELRTDGVSNTLSTVQKDNYICERSIVAMRGRNPENPSDRTVGAPTEQRLEPNSQGICNTITTNIGNDALRNGQKLIEQYRIRKLTPKECWRLMDFSDQDFRKAEAVNSNTQLYKQAGNSIVRNVLVAIFGQMLPGKEDEYKKGA